MIKVSPNVIVKNLGDSVVKRWLILLSLVIMLTCDKIGDCSMQIITPNDYITVQLDCSRNQIKVSKSQLFDN